jgi:hypothetical protein
MKMLINVITTLVEISLHAKLVEISLHAKAPFKPPTTQCKKEVLVLPPNCQTMGIMLLDAVNLVPD